MIKTVDNKNAKRGDIVWEIGVNLKGVYKPTRGVVSSPIYRVSNEDKCWKDYDLCKKECNKRNNKKTK